MIDTSLKTVTAYRVGNRLFKGKRAAYRSIAWRKLINKYAPCIEGDEEGPAYGGDLKGIKQIRHRVCDCEEQKFSDSYGHPCEEPGHFNCPIHDRWYGYLKRVADRYVHYCMAMERNQ